MLAAFLASLASHTYGRKYALALVCLIALLVLGILAALLPVLGPHVATLAGSIVAIFVTFCGGHVLDPSSKAPTKPEAK